MLLGTPTLYPGPPFGIVLAIALVHLLAATAFGAWQRLDFRQGLVIESVAVAFAGLFLAQAMAALPSHNYAMPVNAFVLVLLGVIVEFFARGAAAGCGGRSDGARASGPLMIMSERLEARAPITCSC